MGERSTGQETEGDGPDIGSAAAPPTEGPEVIESGTDSDQQRVRDVVGRRGYDESDDLADENETH